MASCIGLLPAPPCLKDVIAAQTKCLIGTILTGTDQDESAMTHVVGEPNRFIVAFCGSGTGHLTQAMRVVEMLQERGQILAGVVTDTDASEKMLDEMVRPLGVELLIIPAIELVDTDKGFTPLVQPHRFFGSFLNAQKALHERRAAYASFFSRARAGRIYSMWHITLARFFQLNPLPPSITCVHMAAQFGLCELSPKETVTFIEVSTKAVVDFMRDIFVHSGQIAPISPITMPGSLPPIIHAPAPIELGTPKLVLCYFLVSTNVERLDSILAADPMPGVEFHCFTSRPLDKPKSQLHSHMKQRKLFQELFAKCTAVRSQSYSLACLAPMPTRILLTSSRLRAGDRLGRQRDCVGGGMPWRTRTHHPDRGARRADAQRVGPRSQLPEPRAPATQAGCARCEMARQLQSAGRRRRDRERGPSTARGRFQPRWVSAARRGGGPAGPAGELPQVAQEARERPARLGALVGLVSKNDSNNDSNKRGVRDRSDAPARF